MSFDHKGLTSFIGTAVVAAAVAVAAPAAAQDSPLSLEARTGLTFPMGDLSDAGAQTSFIVGFDAFFSVGEVVSVYGGWGHHQFACDACVDNVTVDGPRAGVKVLYHMDSPATPWIRTGLTLNQAEGLADASSDRAVGFETGVGVDYALSPRFSITPGLRYAFFNADFGVIDPTFSYVTLDLGLHVHF